MTTQQRHWPDRQCDQCGDTFTPYAPHGRFCSDRCRVYHARDRKAREAAELAHAERVAEGAPTDVLLKLRTDAIRDLDRIVHFSLKRRREALKDRDLTQLPEGWDVFDDLADVVERFRAAHSLPPVWSFHAPDRSWH